MDPKMTQDGKDSAHSPVAAILLRMKKEGSAPGQDAPAPSDATSESPSEDAGEPGEEGGDLAMASEDLAAAVQSGDAKSISSAFQSMFDICMAKSESGEEDDSEKSQDSE